MTDLDTGYIHDYRSDNQIGALDYSLEQAIDTAADYLIVPIGQVIHSGIVLIESAVSDRNYIDLGIDYDLVDNLDCSCFHNRDFPGNWGNFASALGQLAVQVAHKLLVVELQLLPHAEVLVTLT